ncbi:MAG: PhoH family protein [Bacteroidales bacterium]|jgi:PhoH-like ATPase|nr:PhoH family protein [Bacteroidales bacterium]
MKKLPKIFVLDTNVILHDHNSIYHFQENDLVIPLAVLEELDKFKKGTDTINYNAREFVRSIDEITDPSLFDNGYPLGRELGRLTIEMNHPFPPELEGCFKDDIQDHRILATTIWEKSQHPDRIVGLVTKDVNLRMKARALHVLSQDYLTDHIKEEHIQKNERNVITLKNISEAKLGKITAGNIDINEMGIKRPVNNQLYKFVRTGPKGRKPYETAALGRFDGNSNKIVNVKPRMAYGISPRNDEQAFALDAIMNPEIRLVALTGTAGTGKTLLALAGAIAQSSEFDQIMLARPVIPLKNQELGFLPGNAKEKIGPYMLPLYDNLSVIKKNFGISSKENVHIEEMLKTEKLLISPLAYIRGRSLSSVFFIVDEAQNLTPHEIKTIITRAGEGTKIIFTGDIQQIDQPFLDRWSNGLTHLGDKLTGEKLFEHVNLLHGERSALSELAGKKL